MTQARSCKAGPGAGRGEGARRARAGVLILSEFAGAAQSLGAGAILVNPWNITDMAAAIEDALTMSDQARPRPAAVSHCGAPRCSATCATCAGACVLCRPCSCRHLERVALLTHRGAKGRVWSQERRERHRQNYMHITIHTSQTWADTFISELNDTHVEAELRTKHIPPQVPPAGTQHSMPALHCACTARAAAGRVACSAPGTPRCNNHQATLSVSTLHALFRFRLRFKNPNLPLTWHAAADAPRGGAAGQRGGAARVPQRAAAAAGAGLQRDADDGRGGAAPAQAPLRPDQGAPRPALLARAGAWPAWQAHVGCPFVLAKPYSACHCGYQAGMCCQVSSAAELWV